MTVTVTWKSVLTCLGIFILLVMLSLNSFFTYQQHRWLTEEVGRLDSGAVVTRAVLVDALIQKNFATKPQPTPEAPK